MVKRRTIVVNNSGETVTHVRKKLQPDESYELIDRNLAAWRDASSVSSAIASGDLLVNNGVRNLSTANGSVEALKWFYGLWEDTFFGSADTESSTSSSNYVEKLKCEIPTLIADRYAIKWSFELGNSNSKLSDYRIRLHQIGTDTYTTLAEASVEAAKNGEMHPVSGFTEMELDQDSYEVIVEYRADSHTAKIRRVRVSLGLTTR